jgi:hypothetical protein
MNILVAGGFDPSDSEQERRMRGLGAALGEAVSAHGHVLYNGTRTEFDSIVAEAAHRKLIELGEPDAKDRIISYVLAEHEPSHRFGRVMQSRLTDWELAKEFLYIPETVQQADVVVLVGGYDGTLQAGNWARIANKPLLPSTALGCAAAKLYAEELKVFGEKYGGLVDRLEYERLNAVVTDWTEHATDIVALAEKLVQSRWVLVVMSYAQRPDLVDAYESFEQVTRELGYECERVTEENAEDRILPDILERIKRAAFTIVDLTELRPNVFYELGYADGLGKKVIVTAKQGTDLPFDVKDIPTIFWESQKQLKEDLRRRIQHVVKTAVPNASPPIGMA